MWKLLLAMCSALIVAVHSLIAKALDADSSAICAGSESGVSLPPLLHAQAVEQQIEDTQHALVVVTRGPHLCTL